MSEYIAYLHEVFEQFGAISARKMFGGYGIYHRGVMFALVANDVLYLRVDSHTVKEFESRRLPQFQYNKNGRPVLLSYYRAPDDVLDDREFAATWAQRAFAAALRSKTSPA